jgi:hypothetical protein
VAEGVAGILGVLERVVAVETQVAQGRHAQLTSEPRILAGRYFGPAVLRILHENDQIVSRWQNRHTQEETIHHTVGRSQRQSEVPVHTTFW